MSQLAIVYYSIAQLDPTTTPPVMRTTQLIGSYITVNFAVLYRGQNYQRNETKVSSVSPFLSGTRLTNTWINITHLNFERRSLQTPEKSQSSSIR